jgi:glycosyltransferase involved in cell wall biosynthesis
MSNEMSVINNQVKISIVIPSLNQAEYIEETIVSILSQNYSALELVVIDGGSTDGSQEIIKQYASRLSYWVSETDEGQTDAIMKGLSLCQGELFAWVNSDEVLFPGCLDMVARYYESENQPDIITSNIAYIDSNSWITRFIRVPQQSKFFFFRGVWHGTQPCIFYRTELLRYVGGLNSKYNLSMDIDLWMRVMKAGARVFHIPVYLGGFRWHQKSKTVKSIKTRATKENEETTQIYNENLKRSNPQKREYWRLLYKVYQIVNMNYIGEYADLKKIGKTRNWKDYVAEHQYIKAFIK